MCRQNFSNLAYIERTQSVRKNKELFLITQKPHKPASKCTVASWIKLALKLSGVDMPVYLVHSTRGASTSAAANKVPVDTILRTTGWKKECTFRKFYRKPITNDSSFSHAILSLTQNLNK